jgi:hypothetical protein
MVAAPYDRGRRGAHPERKSENVPLTKLADDPWWLQPCRDAIKQIPGTMCSEQHCSDAVNQNHKWCTCEAPFVDGCAKPGSVRPDCCGNTPASPIWVPPPYSCWCCCSCLAGDTLVATSETLTRKIREFAVGDLVWVAMGLDLKAWAQVGVAFSSGTGEGGENTVVRVMFGELGAPESVYATRDQLFLMDTGKLKRASRLVPGEDALTRPGGAAAPVLSVAAGRYAKGVHHISTSTLPAVDPAGHLIIANGVVAGDYALQIRDHDNVAPELMTPGHAGLPEIGTPEYAERHTNLKTTLYFATVDGVEGAGAPDAVFAPFASAPAVAIPSDARSFVTGDQAADIAKNGSRYPVTSDSARPLLDHLMTLFQGFRPAINFRYESANEEPNAYAFRQLGVEFVVINGGLARTTVLHFEGLALILAQAIGHLYGGDPKSGQGYSCMGVADYASTVAVLPEAFFGERSTSVIDGGIAQVSELFDFIEPPHREGRRGDRCTYISIDCRLKALRAGASWTALPYCAGGPLDATLEVVSAEAHPGGDGPQVTVSYNEAVDPETAGLAAYDFAPVVAATAAEVAPDALSVTITADLTPGIEYVVQANGVTSAGGNPLVTGHNRATFTVPEAAA